MYSGFLKHLLAGQKPTPEELYPYLNESATPELLQWREYFLPPSPLVVWRGITREECRYLQGYTKPAKFGDEFIYNNSSEHYSHWTVYPPDEPDGWQVVEDFAERNGVVIGAKINPSDIAVPILMMAEYCKNYEYEWMKNPNDTNVTSVGKYRLSYCDALISEGAVLLYPNNYKIKVYKDLG